MASDTLERKIDKRSDREGERNGGEDGTKIEMEVDVYLDPTKSDLSRFHSFILSKSKVVVSRTQDLHIP